MFKLQAQKIQDSVCILSEIFVIGDISNALGMASKLLKVTGGDCVEIFKGKTCISKVAFEG